MRLLPFALWESAPTDAEPRAFGNALDDVADVVLALSADGRIVCANTAARALLGDVLGQRLRQLADRTTRRALDEALAAVGTGPRSVDAGVKTADGRLRLLGLTIADAPGPAYHMVVMGRDVTVERKSASKLTQSEARYRQLFDTAGDAILTIDAIGRFTTVNGAAEQISGYRRDELIGRFFGPLLAVEALPRALVEFRRAVMGAAGQFETIMVHKSGERRHLTVNYACPQPMREVICMIRDATAEKQLQLQLIHAEKMGAIGQLVSGVAHELNNPLASISAFSQLLLTEGRLSTQQRHSVDVIRGEATRAARTVQNLLTFARQHKAEKAVANLNGVLRDALELRRYDLNVRGIQVVCDFEETPAPVTMVDVYQLQQVILNLVTNAEHAMAGRQAPAARGHQLTLRTRTLESKIRIEVEDTGGGIPPAALPQVFNPFFTTKPVGQGTGLGLSISLGIVAEHGGRIWAENTGAGARLSIDLPRVEGAEGDGPVAASTAEMHAGEALRILVVDDEEPVRTALARYLANEGHTVTAVATGSEAISRAEGPQQYDAILLDLRMPGVSGQEVFERWRDERRELSDRVVFITGDIVSAEVQAFLEASGRPYVSKPFALEAISEVLPARRVA